MLLCWITTEGKWNIIIFFSIWSFMFCIFFFLNLLQHHLKTQCVFLFGAYFASLGHAIWKGQLVSFCHCCLQWKDQTVKHLQPKFSIVYVSLNEKVQKMLAFLSKLSCYQFQTDCLFPLWSVIFEKIIGTALKA